MLGRRPTYHLETLRLLRAVEAENASLKEELARSNGEIAMGPIPGPRLPETTVLGYIKLRGRGFFPLGAFGEHTNTPFGNTRVTSRVIGPRPLVPKPVRSLDFCSTILVVCDSVS